MATMSNGVVSVDLPSKTEEYKKFVTQINSIVDLDTGVKIVSGLSLCGVAAYAGLMSTIYTKQLIAM